MNERRSTFVLTAMAVAYFLFLLLPSLSPWYGFYSDELYYLACARRPALGYVDHPPFFVLVLRVYTDLFGDSLITLRVLPAAAGAGTGFLAGWMARRLGGGVFAQMLASLCVMMGPGSIAIFNFFTVNSIAILLWTTASWILLELCRSRDRRLWIALGASLGVALLNKHTAVVPVVGVAVGTLMTPLRRDLLGPWPWLGVLAGLLIVSPNLYWQVVNDWPSLAFYGSVATQRYSATALEQIVFQIVYQNPASFPVWVAGVFVFLSPRRDRSFAPLGWLFLTGLVFAIIGGSRLPYRIAGVFPVVFAGGAVLLEARRARASAGLRRLWNTWTLPVLMIAIGLVSASFILPILPPELLARHPLYEPNDGTGFRPEVGRNEIPYHLGNRTHWQAFVATIAEVHEGLTPEERENVILLADYFGHAGAIEYYGRDLDLPPVYSPMTGYYRWGPPEHSPDTLIVIGIDEAFLRENFESIRVATVFRCSYCPPVVDTLPIHIARGPRRPFAALWSEIGGLDDRRTRMLRAQGSIP